MTRVEWLGCDKPDEMLQLLLGKMSRETLVAFVRQCWVRVAPFVDAPPHEVTVVEQFAELVQSLGDMDAAIYAYEASHKAAGWAPDLTAEERHQAELLRRLFPYPGP